MAQTVSYWPLTARARFDPIPVHVVFMRNRVTLGQVLVLIQLPLPLSFCECPSLIHLLITDTL